MRPEGDFGFFDDVLDPDVWCELEFAYGRACRRAAIDDGTDPGDYDASRRWVRDRYAGGDPLARSAAYFQAIAGPARTLREAPWWHAICGVGNRVFMGPQTLVDSPELDDAEDALCECCVDLVEADGVDPEDEAALRAWVRSRYDDGDVTVRAAVLAEATWNGVHDFNHCGRDDAPYEQCERNLVERGGAIPMAIWYRRDRHGGDDLIGEDDGDEQPTSG